MPAQSDPAQIDPTQLDDAALEFLLARGGLTLSDAQKADLKSVYPGIAAMAERVRQPRGRMAELAHVYTFTKEDLP
ncbi:MAG TPA: hypothetical protein VHY35_02110 [Stellaceae bacterium]|jgi:hypothetical protein|nr:hypothetical protein [Stellaceae bacterium]